MWLLVCLFTVFSRLIPQAQAACPRGSTTYNLGKEICDRQLIFEDQFNAKEIYAKWRHTVRFSDYPDYEFNMYDRAKNNMFLSDGVLFLQPSLLSDLKGEDFIYNGDYDLNDYPPKSARCTMRPDSGLCRRTAGGYQIQPPIIAPRITSKFRFRYGTVEVRAKMPRGDWIFPQIELSPPTGASRYGKKSGRVLIALVRGNEDLKIPGADDRINFGNNWLEAGVYAGNYDPRTATHMVAMFNETAWSNGFHTYRVDWEPGKLSFFVDGEPIGKGVVPTSGLLGKPMSDEAPVDEELEVALGVGVGGIQRFPDIVQSNGKPKPWKNLSPKAQLNFWRAKAAWYKTWQGDNTALQIDSIKVWSRNPSRQAQTTFLKVKE